VPSLALAAQVDPALADKIKEEGLNRSKVMEHLDYLTNHIGHRLTGSDNLVKAAYWAASEFERMGLTVQVEQWGEWKVGWNRGQWSGRVLAPEPMELHLATEAWTPGTKGAVRGPLVAAPKTVEEVAQRAEELKGAWVFEVESVPNYDADEGEGGRGRRGGGGGGSGRGVRTALEEIGIAGVLRSSVGTAQHPNRIRVFGDHNVARLDWDRLPKVPRAVVRYDQAKRLAEMLAAGTPVQVEIELRNRFTPGPMPLYNVIAELRGSELPDEYVYVSSHLDSWHQATGTTDNGTGSATTMEAARILAAVGARPRRTIRFALWGGEEQGLLGSGAHVRRLHRQEMDNVSAVFNHDTGTNWAQGLAVTAAIKADMEKVIAPVMTMTPPDPAHDGPVFELRVVPGLSGGGSDHASFLAVNVPAFDWRLTGRSDYFNYTWHTQWDTYDAAIPEYQAHTATVIALVALGTANLPHKLSRENLRAAPRGGDASALVEGWLGARFDGVKVTSVQTDGQLGRAGVQVGDVLKSASGTEVTSLVDLFRASREADEGATLELVFDRNGKEVKVQTTRMAGRRGRRGRGDAEPPAQRTPPPAQERRGAETGGREIR
ncbi:MAG TPA: M20/M25/M40 family metallo-hydrolase, partial [Planctomycetota bacterium]|nr:M20/M25/M40 family metallo-hydrolase [Planctomycetota bacterium]